MSKDVNDLGSAFEAQIFPDIEKYLSKEALKVYKKKPAGHLIGEHPKRELTKWEKFKFKFIKMLYKLKLKKVTGLEAAKFVTGDFKTYSCMIAGKKLSFTSYLGQKILKPKGEKIEIKDFEYLVNKFNQYCDKGVFIQMFCPFTAIKFADLNPYYDEYAVVVYAHSFEKPEDLIKKDESFISESDVMPACIQNPEDFKKGDNLSKAIAHAENNCLSKTSEGKYEVYLLQKPVVGITLIHTLLFYDMDSKETFTIDVKTPHVMTRDPGINRDLKTTPLFRFSKEVAKINE